MAVEDRESMLVVLAAPSGTGKSTIAKTLFERMPRLAFSVSHTTRSPRPGEEDGRHYHFTEPSAFEAMIAADAFAEWAPVHSHRYGTSKAEVSRLTTAGRDILFDVDVQGADQLVAAYPDAVSIFVVPPSLEELERRLRGRGTETEEQLGVRLANARGELACAERFSYLVVNDDLGQAIDDVTAIVQGEACSRRRNPNLLAHVRHMAGLL